MKSTIDRPMRARRRARLAREVQVAGLGLHEVVVAGPAAALVVAAVGRQVRADDARVGGGERRVGEAELVRLVAAQVVEHGVGGADQPVEHRLALGALEVQRHAALVEVQRLEVLAVVRTEPVGAHAARCIAALVAVLDLDDLRPEVGEVHRAEGTGAEVLERQDAHAGERQLQGVHRPHTPQIGFRSTSWRAMMMRCISFGALADAHQRRIAVEALDVEVGRVAVAAEDAHRLEAVLDARLGGEQLGHAGLEVAALARVVLARGLLDQQARCLDAVAMSASLSWIAWCCAMGLPKVSRCCA
ncbi:MAG: hypothetical protein U1F11_12735 [Steroidobacteraceae bacterium]